MTIVFFFFFRIFIIKYQGGENGGVGRETKFGISLFNFFHEALADQ